MFFPTPICDKNLFCI